MPDCCQRLSRPVLWIDSLSVTYLFSNFLPFRSLAKDKGKQWRMKGLTMVQWMNLKRNNRSTLARWYCVLWEKAGPILLLLVGCTAGRQAGKSGWSLKFLNFSTHLTIRPFFAYYHCNVTTVLELHFSWFLTSTAYFKVCFEVWEIWLIFFSC